MARLEKFLGGIKHMDKLPQAMFVIDTGHEYNAIREARKLGIPVIAVVDTNCDPDGVDHVLPGNDDALRSIRFFVSRVAEAIAEGVTLRKETGAEDVEAVVASGDTVAAEMMAAAAAGEAETKTKE